MEPIFSSCGFQYLSIAITYANTSVEGLSVEIIARNGNCQQLPLKFQCFQWAL